MAIGHTCPKGQLTLSSAGPKMGHTMQETAFATKPAQASAYFPPHEAAGPGRNHAGKKNFAKCAKRWW